MDLMIERIQSSNGKVIKIINVMKLSLKSPTIRNTFVYALTDGLCKGITFITLPIISYYLLPEELGVAANFDVLQQIIMLLAGQAIVNAIPYFYYKRSQEEVAQLLSSILLLIIGSSLLFSLCIIVFTNTLSEYLHISIGLQLLSILATLANLITSMNLVVFRLEEKTFHFALMQIIQVILYVSALYFLVVKLRLGAEGKIFSMVLAFTLVSIYHLYLLGKRDYLTMRIHKKEIVSLLKFGIPLLPHSLSYWFKSGFDKILLTKFCGLAINGLYSMSLSFGNIYMLFLMAFLNAYTPHLQKRISEMKEDTENQEKQWMVRNSYLLGVAFFALSLIVIILCKFLMAFVLDEKYNESFQFIPWILISLSFYAFYTIITQYVYTSKKTFGLGIITFSCSIGQLLLTYLLLKAIGVNGIKISIVAGQLFTMLAVWIYSARVYPLPWLKSNK